MSSRSELLRSLVGDRVGLPPESVRCCWISKFTHDAFPCFTIHGNGLGVMETESVVFQVLLDLLGPCLLLAQIFAPSSPLSLPLEKVIRYTGGAHSADVRKPPQPPRLNRLSDRRLDAASCPEDGVVAESITKANTQDLTSRLEKLEFVLLWFEQKSTFLIRTRELPGSASGKGGFEIRTSLDQIQIKS